MGDLGLHSLNMSLYQQHKNALLQHQLQANAPVDATDDGQQAAQISQQEPIVRSPTSTLTAEDSKLSDAATLAATYRARIALAAASPAPSAAPSNAPRGTPGAARLLTFVNSPLPTPTVHGTDQNSFQVLERKWKALYGGMRSNSQAAADVLMKQAQATSQVEELMQALILHIKAGAEDRSRLHQLLLQERSQLMAHAEEAQQLQQRLHQSEHRSTAVQVVTESLHGQLAQARDALEASTRERQQLAEQVNRLAQQLAVTTECRMRGDALISEQTAVIETLKQQLQEQASTMSSLADDKAALEAQLQGVLAAEQELTVHLRETHAAIEGQLGALREQLKGERQKRAAVVKKRGELQSQVEVLQAQVEALQAALADKSGRGGVPHVAPSRAAPVTAGLAAASSAQKPASHVAPHPRGPSAANPARASAGAAGSAHSSAPAATHPRPRSALRSSSAGPTNPRLASQSPTRSGGSGSAGRSAPQRRTSSPAAVGVEETEGAVMLHVPSALPSPEASFAGTSVPIAAFPSAEAEVDLPSTQVTPVAGAQRAGTRARATFAVEPPSPPIALAPVSAREVGGPHAAEPGSASANPHRRRSVSPEVPSRTSTNAVQHARRTTAAAGRPVGNRATSPGGTWLP